MITDPTRKITGDSDAITDPGSTQVRIEKLAQKWQDMQDNGEKASIESVCAACPELLPAVREWLEKFGKMEALLATQAPSTDTLRGSWSPDNVLAAPQGPDELGRLGGYRVLKLIGQGGMGKVYLAEDVKLKRRVALKVLLKGDKRFEREAQTMAGFTHDHIVAIYQIGEDRGTQFLSMPYLEGETLESRLKNQGRLPLAESIRIAKQITQGLAAAHDRKVIHRDIKPSNIWLEAITDRVKILDFGLARDTDGENMLTQEGAVVGTPAFMAPEQAAGNAVDHRADLFSLGCVLYQMISGVSPFARKDVLSTLRRLELETPEQPTVRHPDTPGPLSDLAMKLLEKKQENRPQSAHEVLEALNAIENIMTSGTSIEMAVPPSLAALEATEPQKAAPAGRAFPIAAVAGVAACLAVAAFFFWGPPSAGKKDPGDDPKGKQPAIPVAEKKKEPAVVEQVLSDVSKVPPVLDLLGVEQRDFKVDVELPNIRTDKSGIKRVANGQSLQFKIGVDEDAYVGIWYHLDDGSVRQLFPNRHDAEHFFRKGITYTIPSNDNYKLEAETSKKLERLYVIASITKWDWSPAQADDGAFRMFNNEKQFSETLRGVKLVSNVQGERRLSQISMPVFVSAK